MNPRIAIPALMACVALAIVTASTLRPAKSRLRSTNAPYRPMWLRIERLAAIAAEINAYLLVLAIGLGTLDVIALVILKLPEPAVLGASGAGEVYNLRKLAGFSGNDVAGGVGATLAGGGSVAALENQNA